MNLSVCIITKNEALKLKKCLASLKRYDVEIVVVDTGSTDETLQIIEEYADIKGNYKWNDNFAEARNCSITLANNEWILVLDSDEWIESADMNLINSILLQSDSNIVGRIESINDINLSGENVKGTERISRLFNKKYCHYEGRIHEQVVSNNGDEIKTIDVPIIAGHSGYAGSEDDKKKKSERNIKLLMMDLMENGASPYTYYQIGKSYYMQKDYEKASEYFEKGLEYDLNPKLEYVQDMVETYGYSLLNQKRIQEMMFLENVYNEFAVSADYVFLMGLAYMNNGLFDKAIDEFNKAKLYKLCKIEGCNSYKADYNIGVIYECLGNKEKALENYKKCGRYDPALNGIKRIGCN